MAVANHASSSINPLLAELAFLSLRCPGPFIRVSKWMARCDVRPFSLADQVLNVLFVLQADVVQQVSIEHDELLQVNRPRLRIGLRIIH